MRLKLICCEVLYREICSTIARAPHVVDVAFLPKGLHDIGASGMRARIQAALDMVDESQYDAILLGYGLCNNGLAGLAARSIPLVLPRAHDCITLFLGDRKRYIDYFNMHPGVYFKTIGWIERGENAGELSQLSIQTQSGMNCGLEEMIARYGEDNGRFLFETLSNDTRNYGQFTFIEMGIEPDESCEQRTREEAMKRGWKFEKLQGDISLILRLISGPWDERDFLVVPPGHQIVARYDEGIVAAEPTGEGANGTRAHEPMEEMERTTP